MLKKLLFLSALFLVLTNGAIASDRSDLDGSDDLGVPSSAAAAAEAAASAINADRGEEELTAAQEAIQRAHAKGRKVHLLVGATPCEFHIFFLLKKHQRMVKDNPDFLPPLIVTCDERSPRYNPLKTPHIKINLRDSDSRDEILARFTRAFGRVYFDWSVSNQICESEENKWSPEMSQFFLSLLQENGVLYIPFSGKTPYLNHAKAGCHSQTINGWEGYPDIGVEERLLMPWDDYIGSGGEINPSSIRSWTYQAVSLLPIKISDHSFVHPIFYHLMRMHNRYLDPSDHTWKQGYVFNRLQILYLKHYYGAFDGDFLRAFHEFDQDRGTTFLERHRAAIARGRNGRRR